MYAQRGCQGSRFTGEDTACLSLLVMDEVVMVGKMVSSRWKMQGVWRRDSVSPLQHCNVSLSGHDVTGLRGNTCSEPAISAAVCTAVEEKCCIKQPRLDNKIRMTWMKHKNVT